MPEYYSVPVDSSQAANSAQIAPATNRPNKALLANQGGFCLLGSDYGTTAKAQIPKVDAAGNQYFAVATPAGDAALVFSGQAAGPAAQQYGQVVMARQDSPTPSTFYPLNHDMQMALNVHHKSKPTFRIIGTSITCRANAVLFAFFNNSSQVVRLNECLIYVPPSGTGGALLASASSTYYPLLCELRRIGAAPAGGTALTPMSGDTADSFPSGITAAALPTSTPASLGTFHRTDAMVSTGTGLPWYGRGDQNEKTFVCRPGEGFAVTCISSGTINNASGSGTTTAQVDIEAVVTTATA